LKGEMVLMENWYAGVLHGQRVQFQDGKRWQETNYQYGVRHGVDRRYRGGEIYIESNYVEGRKLSARYFHSNGQPSDLWVGNVLREERDEQGKPILTRRIAMQKLHGAWDIISASKDGKPRADEQGGELTFHADEVVVKLPGTKGTMTMNTYL